MRAATRWLVLTALTVPAPALAQAPSRSALIGVWAHTDTVLWKEKRTGKDMRQVDTLTFYPDSTWEVWSYNVVGVGSEGAIGDLGCDGWFVSGDSLWFGPPATPKQVHGRTRVTGRLPVKATLRGKELTIDVVGPNGTIRKVYKRVGDPKPRKPPIERC